MLKVQTIIVDAVKFHWKSATAVPYFKYIEKAVADYFLRRGKQ